MQIPYRRSGLLGRYFTGVSQAGAAELYAGKPQIMDPLVGMISLDPTLPEMRSRSPEVCREEGRILR